jgi:2'-5' RNA ligase
MSARSFVALPVPQSIQYALGEISASFARQDKANEVRWVDEGNYHITLAFLGEQTLSDLDRLADNLAESRFSQSVDVNIKGISPFPEGSPKLLAALLEENEPLLSLYNEVLKATRQTGLYFEKRRFKPHITLGRLRKPKKTNMVFPPQPLSLVGEVNELIVYESTLTPTGARYDPLHEFSLS